MKKRHTYGTIMIDINTHRVIDLLESRELVDVTEWLKTYPNLKIISRDGSITYHNAISLSHPDAIQISDRFHLLKNLTSYSIDCLKNVIKPYVLIPRKIFEPDKLSATKVISSANHNRKLTLQEKYMKSEELKTQGMNKTQICKSLNMDIRVYNKLQRMNDMEINGIFTTAVVEKSLEKATLKMERVQEVRNLKQQNFSIRKIALITGLSRKTVTKYLDGKFLPIHASTGIKRSSILTPFMEEIDISLERGAMGTVIENKLRNKGYEGSSSTIRNYIANWKRNIKQIHEKCSLEASNKEKVEKLARKDIIKLLFYPLERVNAITQNQFEMLCSEIPLFHTIHSTVWSFRKLLLDKEVEALDDWISAAKILSIKEINSFINGLERDIDAVKNAVKYEYSNGLAEGSVNKLKVIKRIMYSRCSFQTLRIKTLKLEKMRQIN